MDFKTNVRVILAFLIVILAMSSMVALAASGMNALHLQLNEVVQVNAEKLRQVAIMRRSNRERFIGLQHMLLLDDPFEIDEVAMQHMGHANHFIAARSKLFEMAHSGQELDALQRVRETSMMAAPLNEKIRELVIDERQSEARKIMLERLAPAQDAIYRELQTLASHYETQAQVSNRLAKAQYQVKSRWMLALLALVSVLCLVIAIHVTRRISRTEKALRQHRDELEGLVEERTTELVNEVSERKSAEQRARQESERLSVTLASIGDGVVTITPDDAVEFINPAAERLTGLPRAEVEGKPIADVLHLFDRDSGATQPLYGNGAPECARGGAGRTTDGALLRPDGALVDIQQTTANITDANGQSYGSVVVLRDVSEARALAVRLAHEATHDALTGLVNRREFESRLEQALGRARIDNSSYTLCYIDLDRFKVVNDTCGHAAGDSLLCELSSRVRALLRKGDTFARLGGDEFGLLLEQCPIDKGMRIAESIRRSINDYRLVYDDQVLSVGASVGVVEIAAEARELETLLSVADAACYMAKERGRDCVQVYRPSDQDIVERQGETRWARILRSALDGQAFELHAQAIQGVGPTHQNSRHYELLIRLRDDDGSLVYPGSFMPAAERYGLLCAIDRYVIRNALSWLGQNPNRIGTGRLSINVAGASISDPDFLAFVTDTFMHTSARHDAVIFEITENVAVSSLQAATKLMDALRSLGCEFALDDFGRGFSSLGSLKELPVDYLKIDGTFVRDILKDENDAALVQAINNIGHTLGKKTVAEFVENAAIKDRVAALGIDFVQGFGIAKPMPLSQLFPADDTEALEA